VQQTVTDRVHRWLDLRRATRLTQTATRGRDTSRNGTPPSAVRRSPEADASRRIDDHPQANAVIAYCISHQASATCPQAMSETIFTERQYRPDIYKRRYSIID
jgi:hypothetical protein